MEGDTMKWEYKRLFVSEYGPELIDGKYGKLGEYGREGWELVSVDNGKAYFKRPIQPKSEAEILAQFDTKRAYDD